MSLDSNQIKAVEFGQGPALVVAGPGSGKTTVLTHRVRYLINELKVKPEKILVITFTKAAAAQMKQRFENLVDEYAPVSFLTFHSLFYSIICDFRSQNVSLLSPKEKQNIIFTILKENGIFYDALNINELMKEFADCKNSSKERGLHNSKLLEEDVFVKVFKEYQYEIGKLGKPDYDDFSVWVKDIFDSNQKLLEYWQSKYEYCLIDEFQDINTPQYEIVCKMIKSKNIFAVGDEDQSIYGFRGSDPTVCFRFAEEYNATKIMLSTNYRSGQNIVSGACRLIKHNKIRFEKHIKASGENDMGVFKITGFFDYSDEFEKLTDELLEHKEFSSAILLRTNSIPGQLIRKLIEKGLNPVFKEKLEKITDNPVVKDVYSYLKLAKYKSFDDLVRIANKPNRYISRAFLTKCMTESGENISFPILYRHSKDKGYLATNIYKLEMNLRKLKDMDSFEALMYIFNVIGYEKYLYDQRIKFDEILCKLKDLTKEYKTIDEIIDYFRFIETENDMNYVNHIPFDGKKVEIMTMHSAKGLEWDEVYIPSVNEGVIPHKRSLDGNLIEEERRLLYVAITRGRQKVWVSYENNADKRLKPSPFIKELS